jgi:hypothetical protein
MVINVVSLIELTQNRSVESFCDDGFVHLGSIEQNFLILDWLLTAQGRFCARELASHEVT